MYHVGDKVILKALRTGNRKKGITKALVKPFEGPYRVAEVLGTKKYCLHHLDSNVERGVFSVEDLYPYELQH